IAEPAAAVNPFSVEPAGDVEYTSQRPAPGLSAPGPTLLTKSCAAASTIESPPAVAVIVPLSVKLTANVCAVSVPTVEVPSDNALESTMLALPAVLRLRSPLKLLAALSAVMSPAPVLVNVVAPLVVTTLPKDCAPVVRTEPPLSAVTCPALVAMAASAVVAPIVLDKVSVPVPVCVSV